MAFRAPLLGYNTNVRHKGRLYHIQTEDSGVGHPHIITHLFADGGRIVGSKKTSYAEHLNADGLQDTVKKLMQGQHKAMFIALRDGLYDETGPVEIPGEQTGTVPIEEALQGHSGETPASGSRSAGGERRPSEAEAQAASRAAQADKKQPLYQDTLPAAGAQASAQASVLAASTAAPASHGRQSIFGSDLTSEKSLDEVILSYLATDDKE
jgi:hypothetical protein